MYSIFLVDDEKLELELMRDFIRWEDMGIYVAGVGINGKDAQEKIHAVQPDIILTDVQMPLMNGLELAKWVSERYGWMQIVFLTGHDEFNYVKSALHVGAVGYLLKPLDLEEIAGVMERVKQKCEEARLKNKSIQVTKANILKELLYEKNAARRENLVGVLSKLERKESAGLYNLALCSVDLDVGGENGTYTKPGEDAGDRLLNYAREYFRIMGKEITLTVHKEGELVIFIDSEQPPVTREQWLSMIQAVRNVLGMSVTIAISDRPAEPVRIGMLYEDIRKMIGERFYLGSGNVIGAADVKPSFNCDELPPFSDKEWFDALQQLHEEEVTRMMREYFSRLRRLRIGKPHILKWAFDILGQLEELLHSPGVNHNTETGSRALLYHSIYDCQTMQEIETAILQVAEQCMNQWKERSSDKNAKLVQQICLIIDRTYHEPITINSLSSQVYLSPNYLRSIFRDKTGMTIHDYMTRIRLEKAREMLADPSLKVQDIAQKVGYESTSYFISLFLKSQGVTPNEYRKNL